MIVSQKALDLIIRYEVGSEAEYNPRPTWPGGASGITIGVGYDLGYATAQRIGEDWEDLEATVRIRLQSYAGRKGQDAQKLLPVTANIQIPYALALKVFLSCDIPKWSKAVEDTFANADLLSPDSAGALLSLVFNRGTGMGSEADPPPNRRLEMREIRDAMAEKRFADIPGYISAMTRLWQGQGMDGLVSRRKAEAELFASGLKNGG